MNALLLQIANRQSPEALTIAMAVSALPEVVGGKLASHCEVVALRSGTLQVRCSHPAVRSELCSRRDLVEALDVEGVTAVEIL